MDINDARKSFSEYGGSSIGIIIMSYCVENEFNVELNVHNYSLDELTLDFIKDMIFHGFEQRDVESTYKNNDDAIDDTTFIDEINELSSNARLKDIQSAVPARHIRTGRALWLIGINLGEDYFASRRDHWSWKL